MTSVALLAVAGGTVLALRQGAEDGAGATGPLTGTTTGSPSGSPTGSAPVSPSTSPTSSAPSKPASPTASPATSPPPGATGPVKIQLAALTKLPKGRDPQVSYLSGREVLSGAGRAVTIPGTGSIYHVAKLNHAVLAVQSTGDRDELVKVRDDLQTVERVPGVTSLAVSEDATSVAYATTRRSADGRRLGGSTVYAETGVETSRKLSRPNDWDLKVLAHADGKVYFHSGESRNGSARHLYAWTPGRRANPPRPRSLPSVRPPPCRPTVRSLPR